MRPLKVLHIVPSLGVGGYEVWLRNVLRSVDPREVSFDFLVSERRSDGLESEIRARGSKVFCVSPYRRPRRLMGPRLAFAIKRHGPYDVAHCHFVARNYPLFWAGVAGVRARLLHLRETAFGWPEPPALERRAFSLLGKERAGQAATRVLAVSRTTAASWYPAPSGDNPCEVFYGGISMAGFDAPVNAAEVRRSLGLPERAWVIGHVGRLTPVKNQAFLLDVFARLGRTRPDARLLLIGDGPTSAELRARARALNVSDRVVFAGTRPDVPALLRGAVDHFVFPSSAEGLPNAVVEAQAAGLPITLSEVITREADVVPPLMQRLPLSATADDWASAILAQAGDRLVSPDEARERVRRSDFTIDKSAARLLALYRREAGRS